MGSLEGVLHQQVKDLEEKGHDGYLRCFKGGCRRAARGASRWEREPFLKNNVIHLGVQNEGMCNKLLVTEQV